MNGKDVKQVHTKIQLGYIRTGKQLCDAGSAAWNILGLDISPVAMRRARALAKRCGLLDR